RPRSVGLARDLRRRRCASDAGRDRSRRAGRTHPPAREASTHGAHPASAATCRRAPVSRRISHGPSPRAVCRRAAGSTPRSPERRDGWLGARQLARILPRRGSLPGPDLVVLMLDPVADLVSISPGHLAALGRRVPAKPYFSLVEGRPVPFPPFALA